MAAALRTSTGSGYHEEIMKLKIDGLTITGDPEDVYLSMLRQMFSGSDGTQLPQPLGEVKTWATRRVDVLRGEAREEHVPNIYGQAHAYAGKLDQAQRFQADPAPVANDYPALYGDEATERGLSPTEMSNLIISKHKIWVVASDEIDAIAFKAKANIESAVSVKEVVDILVSISGV